jgi:hypothetical protein
MSVINLTFPELSGVERGAKLLAQEFKSRPLYYLARETIQNSLDAWDDSKRRAGEPARIVFKLHEVPADALICRDKIKAAFGAAESYWKPREEMFKDIWNAAKTALSKSHLRILEVSDYNTCGLDGNDGDVGSRWHSLVKSEGVPNPNAGAGGSYGIGKMAPFACSDLRTVLYSSYSDTGHAFQGVCRLATFIEEERKRAPDGFIGYNTGPVAEPHVAVRKDSEIPAMFRRTERGTSVWCLGFIEDENWARTVMQAAVDSFWMAIERGSLVVEVKVGDTPFATASKESLDGVIAMLGEDAHLARHSLEIFRSPEVKVESKPGEIFTNKLGKVSLFLGYPKTRDKASNQCYQVRNNFMRIRSNRWRCPIDYTAVLVCDDSKGSAYLRSMEPPSHEDWIPALLAPSEQRQGAIAMNALEDWVKRMLIDKATAGATDAIDEKLTFDDENKGASKVDLNVDPANVDPFGHVSPSAGDGNEGFGGVKGLKRGKGKNPKRPPIPRPDGTVDGAYYYARVVSANTTSAEVILNPGLKFGEKPPRGFAFTTVGSDGSVETLRVFAVQHEGRTIEREGGADSPYFKPPQELVDGKSITVKVELPHVVDLRLGIRFSISP